ncbi:MAG: PHP domain-containing protein [Nanoarchaeota archaeon]|nr:PHP domain-containing protein [Nanoarchaeota archaeon]MCG2717756.1 PHP domain-containing protein [Nanoarchaeota archaeon]
MLKADLHTHTNYVIPKRDSKISPKQLIDFLAARDYDVLAITEHASMKIKGKIRMIKNPTKTYFHFKDYAKKKGILLVPGVETFIEGKEVLLINFKGDATRARTFADVERLKEENVLVMAPHPFYGRGSCLKNKLIENIKIFDAIEHCHFYTSFFNPNKKAIMIAKKYNKPLVASSDAHRISQLNTNFSLIDAEKNVDSVLESIRKNKVGISTRPLPLYQFLSITIWAVLATIKQEYF